MQTNGANHTPKISQSHIALRTSSQANNHPRLSAIYAPYLLSRISRFRDGDEMERGIPRTIASDAAREKFTTVVIEMTVDARQRFKALRRRDVGAIVRPS